MGVTSSSLKTSVADSMGEGQNMVALRAAEADHVVALVESWSGAGWPLVEDALLRHAAELGWQPFATKGYFTTDLPIAANRASYVTIDRDGAELVTQVDFTVADRPAEWSAEGIADVARAFAGYSAAFEDRWGSPVSHEPGRKPIRVWRLPTACGVALHGNQQGLRVHVYSPTYLEAWLALPDDE